MIKEEEKNNLSPEDAAKETSKEAEKTLNNNKNNKTEVKTEPKRDSKKRSSKRSARDEKKEILHILRNKELTKIVIICAIVLVAIIIIAVGISKIKKDDTIPTVSEVIDIITEEDTGEVITVNETELQNVIKTTKIYTAEYPYSGYTTVYEDDGVTVKYYVAYQGTVKAGIDVKKIKISLDEATHTITVRLPKIDVEDPVLNNDSLDFIFENEKYNNLQTIEEANQKALDDLKASIKDDASIIRTATDSAKIMQQTLIEQWVNQVDENTKYTVIVLGDGEEAE